MTEQSKVGNMGGHPGCYVSGVRTLKIGLDWLRGIAGLRPGLMFERIEMERNLKGR